MDHAGAIRSGGPFRGAFCPDGRTANGRRAAVRHRSAGGGRAWAIFRIFLACCPVFYI